MRVEIVDCHEGNESYESYEACDEGKGSRGSQSPTVEVPNESQGSCSEKVRSASLPRWHSVVDSDIDDIPGEPVASECVGFDGFGTPDPINCNDDNAMVFKLPDGTCAMTEDTCLGVGAAHSIMPGPEALPSNT